MGEVEGRLLADHVVVQGDDVDARLAQRPQHRLDLVGGHDEVAVHRGELVAAGNAAQVVRPIEPPTLTPCIVPSRPMVTFTTPSWVCALWPSDLLDRPRRRSCPAFGDVAGEARRRLRRARPGPS